MNKNTFSYSTQQAEALQGQFALRVTARLSASADELPHDITERLRVARLQALGHQKTAAQAQHQHVRASNVLAAGTSAILGGGGKFHALWSRFGFSFAAVALVVGAWVMGSLQEQQRAIDVAEVDTALLSDDLPPQAYADPGFVQFMQSGTAGNNAAR